MVSRALLALLLVLGCTHRREANAPATRSSDARCTLRMSDRGMLVDGDRVSPTEAIALCKQTGAAMVVIENSVPCSDWEPTRAALRRERVAIYMRGPVGDFRQEKPIIAANAPSPKPSRVTAPRCQ